MSKKTFKQEPQKEQKKNWVYHSQGKTTDLDYANLFVHARELYIQQTNWFLHHEQVTMKNLGAIFTAEFAVTGSYFTFGKGNIPFMIITSSALVILTILVHEMANYGCKSCKKSYYASMEYAMLKSKVAWILGFTNPIAIKSSNFDSCPAPNDRSLYIPRHLNIDNPDFDTTTNFVNQILTNNDNTFNHSGKKIIFFKRSGILFSFGAIGLILAEHFFVI